MGARMKENGTEIDRTEKGKRLVRLEKSEKGIGLKTFLIIKTT